MVWARTFTSSDFRTASHPSYHADTRLPLLGRHHPKHLNLEGLVFRVLVYFRHPSPRLLVVLHLRQLFLCRLA